VLVAWGPAVASAQVYEVATDLSGSVATQPWGGVVKGSDGNLYGTTAASDTPGKGCGTVYRVTPDGTLTVLHEFARADGCFPVGELVEGLDGNLYGTTSAGGPNSDAPNASRGTGTVFRITPAGVLSSLHAFAPYDHNTSTFPEGIYPFGGLALGPDGNFYGTTNYGGPAGVGGTIFKVTPAGVLTVLHSLAGLDGGYPNAGVSVGSDGNLYGTTIWGGGGPNVQGTVYQVTPTGSFTEINGFPYDGNCNCTPFGSQPLGEPVRDADGNLYGTTQLGGPPNVGGELAGTVWKLSPAGDFTLLHAFTGPDGGLSSTGLTMGSDGNLYGVTYGVNGFGTVFRVTLGGVFTNLHSFSQSVGPDGRLFETSAGVFVGTTNGGGAGGKGLVFRLTLASATTTGLDVSPASSVFGQPLNLTATLSAASGTPPGSIEFFDGTTSLGTSPLNGGVATLSTAALASGTHNVGASYAGEGSFLPSVASPVTVTVSAASTTTTINASANPINRRQLATLTATVAAVAPGGGTVAGQVVFKEGRKTLGTAALVNGQAFLNVSYTKPGSHAIVATFGGNGSYLGSASQAYTLVVSR
jgi:uncharacterized repeat protein (TIGR03803 family)